MTTTALDVVDQLADWSPWFPFDQVRTAAPKNPGVYLAREGCDGELVYVGMAGERRGQGLRGRLTIYARGRALASGLGEAVLDRAFADPVWLRERLAEAEAQHARRAKLWGVLAFERADLHMCWSVTQDRAMAVDLERRVLSALVQFDLWNRLR